MTLAEKATELRRLHTDPDLLVLANVWDVASAQVMADLPGGRAIATGPSRGMRTLPRTASNTGESWRCPGVVSVATGRHRASATRWILVLNPPRERPSLS